MALAVMIQVWADFVSQASAKTLNVLGP